MSISQHDVLANPNIPLSRMKYIDTFSKIAYDAQQEAIADFEPHTLTAEEIQATREETLLRIEDVLKIEKALEAAGGPPHYELENELFKARVRYRPPFCRLFRVNDLPEEILTDVFRLVIWTGPSPAVSNNWRLWLTWVCKKWRKMVISDPTLWNAIWFRDPYPFVRSFTWFNRAGNTPLDIRITDTMEYTFNGKAMSCILDTLWTKIRQIRLLIVIVEDWEPAVMVLDRLRKVALWNCPMILERLEIHRSSASYHTDDMPRTKKFKLPIPLFGGAHLSSFHSLSLYGMYLDWSNTRLSNLHTLDLRRMPFARTPDLATFRAILVSSPNLYRLCLDGAGPKCQGEEGPSLDPIYLPRLKRFVCANFRLDYAMFIMRQINAPNVRDLHLFNFFGRDYTPLFHYLTGRFPDVRMLTIFQLQVSQNLVMVRWLTSMRRLIYLRVANLQPFFLNFFLHRADPVLVPKGQQPTARSFVVCPHISFLELNNRVDPNQAVHWIQERGRMRCPLEKVYITKALSTNLTDDEHSKLSKVCYLYRLELGAIPPEEDMLLTMP